MSHRRATLCASLVDGLASSYSNFMERILSAWADVLNITERTVANGGIPASDELSRLMPEITAPTERLRFNVLYRGPQKFACTEIPLAEVKAIRHTFGTSINDVLLALVTATVRRYSEFHGDSVKGRLLRIMVPVNLRGNDELRVNWGTASRWSRSRFRSTFATRRSCWRQFTGGLSSSSASTPPS